MNERALHPANVAAAAVLIGGVALVAAPHYGLSIVRLVVTTVAVASALYVLVRRVPASGWVSPFKWMSPFHRTSARARRRRVGQLDVIRAGLEARRQGVDDAPPLPPAVLRLLRPLVAAALDIDRRDRRTLASARDRVSAVTWAVLHSDPLLRSRWLHTVRADRHQVAEVVHTVLDDIDLLTNSWQGRQP